MTQVRKLKTNSTSTPGQKFADFRATIENLSTIVEELQLREVMVVYKRKPRVKKT